MTTPTPPINLTTALSRIPDFWNPRIVGELNGQHVVGAFGELPEEALTLVEVPALAISSTDCRARAAQSRPIWYLVPDGVVQYVSKRGLYRKLGPIGRMAGVTLEEGT